MIARLWHGRAHATYYDTYYTFLQQRAIPDYQSVAGNRGVYIMRRREGDIVHFVTLSFWDSEAAIEANAWTDIAQAKYYPEDKDFLLELEPTVIHYEVTASPTVE